MWVMNMKIELHREKIIEAYATNLEMIVELILSLIQQVDELVQHINELGRHMNQFSRFQQNICYKFSIPLRTFFFQHN
jgi:hypothetical protein